VDWPFFQEKNTKEHAHKTQIVYSLQLHQHQAKLKQHVYSREETISERVKKQAYPSIKEGKIQRLNWPDSKVAEHLSELLLDKEDVRRNILIF